MSRTGKQSVYFAVACGKVKIGCSVDPESRLATIGEWVPFPTAIVATMPGSYDLESAIHRMFDDEWSHGEWFHASHRLLAFIETVASGKPVEIAAIPGNTRRNAFIAEKKRLAHRLRRLSNAGVALPTSLDRRLRAVRKGQPIPSPLLGELNHFISESLAA